jgi:hypothetical protein
MCRKSILLEKDYKQSYFKIRESCHVRRSNVKKFIAGFKSIPYVKDDGAKQRLKLAVSRQPVVVAVSVGKFFKKHQMRFIKRKEIRRIEFYTLY